ncbi:outer membrane surface antigen [Kaistia soli DSM 19436]|uniref:Outer membrane surface antigen n=1 Tax=Kaistia soli DSM 19436 TaxID=1122133 RepID=A0A1M4VXA8_9HYPH|nr:RT0821/Lpp0805 family surface protein [Kaistia soli]SHE73606.1 outer membrane surface antigen [Kaistia soli DSM 19436]
MRRIAALILFAGGLAGCGLTPFSHDGVDTVTTGSITPAATPQPVQAEPPAPTVVGSLAQSDWESIRTLAANRLADAPNGDALDWTNPDTGNEGTIAALADTRSRTGGLSCRPIALTVSDVRGVRRYHGHACRSVDGSWQLFDMSADDKALL